MSSAALARALVRHEAHALLCRVAQIGAFALQVPMVSAAAPAPRTLLAIERHVVARRRDLARRVDALLDWLDGPGAHAASPADVQRRFVSVRLRFNAVLSEFDIFADALGQRAEHKTGVFLAGIDRLAEDALALPPFLAPPPVVCYLDRGIGAAIRRARTRLPTGARSPVAVVRIPRERMIGAGIASSLAHEVGHQAVALLGLLPGLKLAVRAAAARGRATPRVWPLWDRWISEIAADVWAVARIGIGAAVGLLGVVSLPAPFVFRVSLDDPHPPPWIRVRLACAIGQALYPHPQWDDLARSWAELYPAASANGSAGVLGALDESRTELVETLLEHRPATLDGNTLGETLHRPDRTPERLLAAYRAWRDDQTLAARARPSLAFAVVGQARAAGLLEPGVESDVLSSLLTRWALERAVQAAPSPLPRAHVSITQGEAR